MADRGAMELPITTGMPVYGHNDTWCYPTFGLTVAFNEPPEPTTAQIWPRGR